MDELAHELGIDPIELRLRNEPDRDESNGLPFSTRRLRECYTVGAREFGWHRRNPRPRSTRDGDWLIGTGMAAGVYDTRRGPGPGPVRLDADGTALVESATSDMGPGTYTSMTQVAADALGLTMRHVSVPARRLALCRRPRRTAARRPWPASAPPSRTAATRCASRRSRWPSRTRDRRCTALDPADVVVRAAGCTSKDNPARGETYRQLLARNNRTSLEAHGSFTRATPPNGSPCTPTARSSPRSPWTPRWAWCGCGGCSACTTRAGSSAPSSPTARHRRHGRRHRHGPAGTHGHRPPRRPDRQRQPRRLPRPRQRRRPRPRAIYLDGEDTRPTPSASRASARSSRSASPAAIANAVFHATGRRIRELPITAEALL